ncbi:MAG: alkaline phosphatase D family protein [Solirubrobacteraceae bacterium]
MSEVSRRQLLTRAGAAGAALTVGGLIPSPRAMATFGGLGGYPFVAGVASGDPGPDRIVLWTKLALDPLGDSPLPARRIPVAWEIAEDERLRRGRRSGLTLADPAHDHSVHVDLAGLRPGREYWYRFYAGGEASPLGRTRTAPAFGHGPATLRFCFVSCSQFEHGYFTAYKRIVEDDPAFLIHTGDYIYEYGTDVYEAPGGNVRHHVGGETTTLTDYRRRYGQYHTDADLLEARRLIPFITTPDDHEVENNYAGVISEEDAEPDQDPAVFRARRTAAYRAYAEWMPMRHAQVRPDGSLRLFRELPMGDLCDVIVADTRQFRTDQPCDDDFSSSCPGMTDPAQTLPGLPQERWLVDRFARSRSRWNLLAQQVQMAQEDFVEGPGEGFNTDSWDGYKESRRRVLSGIARARASNTVVLTGDVHQHYASDLTVDFADPSAPIVASEFVGTSIASGGDGSDNVQSAALRENPWIKYNASRRGYVRIDLSHAALRADMRILPYVSRPGAPASTGAAFVIEDGRPGLQRA